MFCLNVRFTLKPGEKHQIFIRTHPVSSQQNRGATNWQPFASRRQNWEFFDNLWLFISKDFGNEKRYVLNSRLLRAGDGSKPGLECEYARRAEGKMAAHAALSRPTVTNQPEMLSSRGLNWLGWPHKTSVVKSKDYHIFEKLVDGRVRFKDWRDETTELALSGHHRSLIKR